MEAIWNISVGDSLVSLKTLEGDNYPFDPVQLFTSGKHYQVIEVFPLRPAALVIDDTGGRNFIYPDFLVNFRHEKIDELTTI